VNQYKQGVFFSQEFVGANSWNGFEYNCLFANRGGGSFIDVGRAVAADTQADSRGAAVADFDGDGRLDLALNNNNARPTLLLNQLAQAGNWVELDLIGAVSNRDAVGARVRLTSGGRSLSRWVEAGSGYASQSAHTLHFGLGEAERIEAVEIDWPSGHQQRLAGAELAATVRLNDRATVQEPGSSVAEVRTEESKREG